jgi:hypothetical protein
MMNQRIYAASKGKRVSDASIQEIAQMLLRCTTFMGIPPTRPESTSIIHSFLTQQVSWATLQDIELAVSLNATMQLPVKTEHYGELSGAFLGSLLAVYQPIRGKAVSEYSRIEESASERLKLKEREITDSDWIQMLERDQAHYSAGREHWTIGAARMVRWLYETERLKDDDFSAQEWKEMKWEASKAVMTRKQIGPKALESMASAAREAFDQDCLVELRAVVYGRYKKGRDNA